jgi:outer membrane protein OmpA-like peptidoglycan-associated protein
VNKALPGGLPAPAPPTASFSDIKQPADLARGAIYRLVVHADKVAEFPDIQFELGSWKIQEGESKELVRGAGVGILILMNAHSDWRFLIEGHTCDIGESSYNARLSWLRAFAVCSELGLPPDLMTRLVPLGCGEKYAKQLSGNSPCLEQLRAPERRVRIWVLSKDS